MLIWKTSLKTRQFSQCLVMQAVKDAEIALVDYLSSKDPLQIIRAPKLQYLIQLEIQVMPIRPSQLLISELISSTIIQIIIAAP